MAAETARAAVHAAASHRAGDVVDVIGNYTAFNELLEAKA